jgi:hypothetical protein
MEKFILLCGVSYHQRSSVVFWLVNSCDVNVVIIHCGNYSLPRIDFFISPEILNFVTGRCKCGLYGFVNCSNVIMVFLKNLGVRGLA